MHSPRDPTFIQLYAPPRWPTLPETGEAYASRAYLPGVGTVGYFVYTPETAAYYAVQQHDEGSHGVEMIVRDILAQLLTEGAQPRDVRDAVRAAALFDTEERVDLPQLYNVIRQAWRMTD